MKYLWLLNASFLGISVIGLTGSSVGFKIGQKVFGYSNAEFLLIVINVMQTVGVILVWLTHILIQYLQHYLRTPNRYVNLETQWDWKRAGGVVWTHSMRRTYLVISLLMTVPGFVWVLSGVDIPADVQAMLSLLLIVMVMTLNYLLFNVIYTRLDIFAAILVILGAMVAAISDLRQEMDHAHKDGETKSHASLYAYAIFIPMGIPFSYGMILTEHIWNPPSLETKEIEVSLENQAIELKTFNGVVEEEEEKEEEEVSLERQGSTPSLLFFYLVTNFISTIFLCLCTPAQRLLLKLIHEPQDDFSAKGGLNCFLGKDPSCGGHSKFLPMGVVMAIVFFELVKNIAQLGLTKYGSAMYMTLGHAVALPVISLCMSSSILKDYRESASVWNIVGIIFCFIGVSIFTKSQF